MVRSVIIRATRNWRGGRVFTQPPKVGKRVHHTIFGAGTVVMPEQRPNRWSRGWVRINFDAHGHKEFAWSFCVGKISALMAVKP